MGWIPNKMIAIVIEILSRDLGLFSPDLIDNQILHFSLPDSAVGQTSSNLLYFWLNITPKLVNLCCESALI